MDLPYLFYLGVRVRDLGTYLLTVWPWVRNVSYMNLCVFICKVSGHPTPEKLWLPSDT